MKLTRVERLLLSNQLKILEKLYPDETSGYAEHRKALEDGYESHFEDAIQHISEDVLTQEESTEVLDVLEMFTRIKHFQEAYPNDVTNETRPLHFIGYDGNNEYRQLSYATYFCGLGRFTDLEIKEFNSHMPCVPIYRRMLVAWNESKDKYNLTAPDLERIAVARIHPENRKK